MANQKQAKDLQLQGAQAERTAFRRYLKRQIPKGAVENSVTISSLLAWVDGRVKRYKARKGGLK